MRIYRGSLCPLLSLSAVPVMLLAVLALAAVLPASVSAQEFTPSWHVVVDRANLLDDTQEGLATDDAWRLTTIGTPVQVITELAQSTPQLASQRAAELRLENGIESAPGADDGILIYAAVNPGRRSIVEIAISLGINAVPRGGLTSETVDDFRTSIVSPQLQAGAPDRAIVFALREMHYLQVFTPPPAEPLEGWRSTLHSFTPIIAPVAAALIAAWISRSVRNASSLREGMVPIAIVLGASFLLAVISVLAGSGIGVVSALILLAFTIWIAVRLDEPRPATMASTVTVSVRPPGRMRPLSRTAPR